MCVILKGGCGIIGYRFQRNTEKGMITAMQNSGRCICKHRRTSLFPLLLLTLLSLAVTLSSCKSEELPKGADDSAATETSGEDPKTSDSTLSYYIALVGRLEAELLQLKEKIFLLQYGESVPVDRPMEPEDTTTSLPSEKSDYTYEIVNGSAVITAYCGSGGDVVIPASLGGYPVKVIGDSAFAKSAVTSVVLPDTLTKIDWFAFRDCLSLTAVVGGDGVTEIGYGAFDGCPAALVVICPKGSYLAAYAASFGIAVRNR